MDRWLKTGSFVKSDGKVDEQSTASSSVPDLGSTERGDIESCSEVPSRQSKSNEKIDKQGEKKGRNENMTLTICKWVFISRGKSQNLNHFV